MELEEAINFEGGSGDELSGNFPENHYTLNPLDVDLVIRKVISFLDANSLREARRVCRRWNLHAADFFHSLCSKQKIIFTDDHWDDVKTYGIDGMRDFVRFVQRTGECPFLSFDIGTSIIIEKGNERVMSEFVHFCGDFIEELTIRDDWDDWDFEEGTRNPGIPKDMQFHRLRKLSFNLVGDSGLDRLELFYSLMKASPQLEHLVLRTVKVDDGEAVEWLIKSLVNCSCDLTTLDIFAPVQEAQLLTLSALGLKLKSLSIDLWGSRFSDPNIMKSFLRSQSKTLKFLKISDEARSFVSAFEFPCMEELQTLTIKGSILGSIAMSFPLVSYDQFPNLKTLSFSTLAEEWDYFLKKPSLTVEELKLPSSVAYFDTDSLQLAAYQFLNLRKLEIPHHHLLEAVYETMTQLEELTINTNDVSTMDNLITGIPYEICEAINETGCYNTMLKDIRLKVLQTSSSITSLTKLKTFRLKCKVESQPVEITDISCYLALFQMKSLKCLDFGRRPVMFTPECLREMKARYKVTC